MAKEKKEKKDKKKRKLEEAAAVDEVPAVDKAEKKRRKKEKAAKRAAKEAAAAGATASPEEKKKKKKKKDKEPAAAGTVTAAQRKVGLGADGKPLEALKVLISDPQGNDVTSTASGFAKFADAGMDKELLDCVLGLGFHTPTPIQMHSISLCKEGKDVVAIAETGSGKTLAFMIPALAKKHIKKGVVTTLVLAPTRELAIQTQVVTATVAPSVGAHSVCVYGGDPKHVQLRQLQEKGGANVIIATPGRLLDLAENHGLDLTQCDYLVLDEADRMLDMGFEPQIKKIVALMPKHQTLMFSATWPPDVRKMATTYLKNAWQVSIGDKVDKLSANTTITQVITVAEERMRFGLLQKYLNTWTDGPGKEKGTRIMIFMLYKKSCQRMADDLWRAGWNCDSCHGDKNQSMRNAAVEAFKAGTVPILVCTDVAARGLDIKDVKYVVNVEFPLLCEDWVHRVGRTGRAGATGTAVTFFGWDDRKHARELNHILSQSGATTPKEFDDIVEKAPPWISRRTNAERMFGRGAGGDDGRPMKEKTHVTFD